MISFFLNNLKDVLKQLGVDILEMVKLEHGKLVPQLDDDILRMETGQVCSCYSLLSMLLILIMKLRN